MSGLLELDVGEVLNLINRNDQMTEMTNLSAHTYILLVLTLNYRKPVILVICYRKNDPYEIKIIT